VGGEEQVTKRGTNSADAEEWFREAQFRIDVKQYLKRQGIKRFDQVAILSDLTTPTVRGFLTGSTLTVRTMAALARMADLCVDDYVLTESQHEAYLDAKFTRHPSAQQPKETRDEDG
jgi:hypothetical protein